MAAMRSAATSCAGRTSAKSPQLSRELLIDGTLRALGRSVTHRNTHGKP